MRLKIKTRLFLSFTLLSSILVASSGALFYWQSAKDLMSRVEETNRQQLYRYQEALDHAVEDMDRISAQVVYSSDIKNYLYERLSEDNSSYQSFAKRKQYEDLLQSFNGPWFIASQINLIALDGFFLTYGQVMDTVPDIREQIRKAEWIHTALAKNGEKMLLGPHISSWQDTRPVFFSLIRSFNSPGNQPPAVVEVQQPYELLDKTVNIGLDDSSSSKIYIVNDEGELFYPYIDSASDKPYIPEWSGSNLEMESGETGEPMLWSQLRSDFSGLTVLIEQPKKEVMAPVVHLKRLTFLLAIFGESVALLIAYALSEHIASPIRYLQKRLEKLNIDNVGTTSVAKLKNIKEIGLLYDTFEEMKVRLNQSLNEVLQSQKRENVAHLQAMYAQMNPHFLFNTLTAMASYAEETGFRDFSVLTQRLSGMLRYSTNPMADGVALKQELKYTIQYMELMQFRYDGQFAFSIHADSLLDDEPVPKFLLQPLAENSFAHGFKDARPPWRIEIAASYAPDGTYWEIILSDNGAGFSDAAYHEASLLIAELNAGQIRQLDTLSAQGLGHLGMINTLTRCRLFWNDKVSFSLRNLAAGMEFKITVRR